MILFIYEDGDFQVLMWGLFVLHLQAVFANTHIYSDAKLKKTQKLRGIFLWGSWVEWVKKGLYCPSMCP